MSFKNLIKARGRRRKSISDTVPEISKIRFRRTEADEKGMSSSYIVKSKTKTISQKRYDKLREKADKKSVLKKMIPWAQRRKYKNL